MCSAEYFRAHSNAHVLPIGENEIVPLAELGVTERYPVSDLIGGDTEDGGSTQQSGDGHRAGHDQEMRNEILIECVLDLTLEGPLDKETVTQYLSQRFRELDS